MNATVQINSRGTLTIPKAMRRAMGIENGGVVVAETAGAGIILRPTVTFPVELYTDERIREFDAADADLGRHLKRKRK